MSKLKIITRDIKAPAKKNPTKKKYHFKYEVQAPANLFGKRIRKKFHTKSEANTYRLEMETMLQNQRLSPLEQDVHLCAARYQKTLSVDQMEAALAGAIEFYDQSNKPFKEYADAYKAEVDKDFKRGRCGQGWVDEAERGARKLTEWLDNPKIREITKEMIDEFIDCRLDDGAAAGTVNGYLKHLSTILSRAFNSGVINRNPMKNVKKPKSDPDAGILTPDELQTLLSKASSILDEREPWFALTDSELQKMVWYKPVTEVAKEMGVSDVAIRKRCRKAGIKTPPFGFWAKVKAGKLPHPEGKHEGNGRVVDKQAGVNRTDPANIPVIMIPRLMFGCFAGLRSSEIERLTWENVKLDVGQLFMTKGKNKNSERYVTLTPPLLD